MKERGNLKEWAATCGYLVVESGTAIKQRGKRVSVSLFYPDPTSELESSRLSGKLDYE